MTPGEFQALKKVWEDQREYETRRHADILAALYNIPLQVGFTPPSGKAWTAAMFLPGIESAVPDNPDDDWKKTKGVFDRMAEIARYRNRPVAEKRAHKAKVKDAQRVLADRKRRAVEMREAGEPSDKIRAMMKGLPYG